jgi:hypothetical protein
MDRCIKPRLLRLSKIEAAKLQIESAIWLWFVDGNIVPVQTLVAAAQRILLELADLWEVSAWPVTAAYLSEIPANPEKKDGWSDDAVSFFKDAKRNEMYEVSEQWTELNLFDAVMAYGNLAGDRSGSALMSTFVVRFGVERQELFVPDAFSLLEKRVSKTFNLQRLERLTRLDFLKEFLEYPVAVR